MPFASSEPTTSINLNATLSLESPLPGPQSATYRIVPPATSPPAQQVIFIDSALESTEGLIDFLSSTAVYLLEADQDGASFISDTLAQYAREQVESVHIFTHGLAGSVQLGGITLSADNVTGYSEDLADWSQSITSDVLLYGCNVGEGAAGQAFVQQLADLTGADIQASDDLTGAESLGGDWDLEVNVGEIDSGLAITAAGQASYQGTLAQRTITSNGGGPTALIEIDEGTTAITDVESTSDTNSDTEGNGITYYIKKGDDKRFFNIDNDTGVISFKSAPDFETPKDGDGDNVYIANVIAVDSSGDSDSQLLSVVVRDVNESSSAPVITDIGSRFPNLKRLEEGSKFVANIDTFDADGDTERNGITYQIDAGADASLFRINRRGLISFRDRPNFETPADADGDNIYEINVTATDSTGLSDSRFIQFEVLDVAGDEPIVATVVENETLVSDLPERDPFDRSFVSYSLSGTDAGFFEVVSGNLQFKATPDFDLPVDADGDNIYQFTLTSFNERDIAYVQTVSVTVEAAPPPIIISDGGGSTAAIEVDEEAIFVTDVEATSAIGDGEGAGFIYSLNAGEDAALFNIDTETGVITFREAPDFENPLDDDANNVYRINVLLQDSLGNTDSQFLSVIVRDIIDSGNAPVISTSAAPSAVEGSSLAIDIEATDADGDTEGSGLTYRINAGEDKDLFSIDADTGELFFTPRPDFENPQDDDGDNIYRVNVLVTDSTGLITSQFLQVSVTDNPNDVPLDFSIVENTTAVSTLPTNDTNGSISYSLSGSDAAFFEVDSAGTLQFISEPDFETPADADADNVYTFSLTGIDAQNVATVQTVSVTVTNQVSVYLFAGQSNAAGVGSDAADLTGDIANPQTAVQIWEEGRNRFTALRPGFNKNFGTGTGFGSELNFGFLLEQARVNGTSDSEEIYIVKYALGSTNIAVDWNVNGGVNGADNQYDIFTEWVGNALANLTNAGLSYEVEGMTWMQGENDAFVPEFANAYEANLTALIADVRSRYSADLSFVIGRLHDELPNGFQSAAIVRTAQSNVAAADPLTNIVDTDGYLVTSDSVHFTSQGHLDLGRDFAQFFID